MENFLSKADYNQGARDMAILFLADLRCNGGKLCAELKKQDLLAFIDLIEEWVATGWNATEMCLHAHPRHGFNFEFIWKEKKIVAIKFIRGE